MFAERPKRGESEEDLLKLQDEFFKKKAENKVVPAAKVIISNKKSENNHLPQQEVPYDPQEHLDNTFEDIPKTAKLGSVVERPRTQRIPSLFAKSAMGFPRAKRRDPTIKPSSGSIFASQIKKFKTSTPCEQMDVFNLTIKERNYNADAGTTKDEKKDGNSEKNLPKQSYILMGEDKDELHEENINKLQEMTEEEIFEEREQLIEAMDPAILAFLRSRRDKTVVPEKAPSVVEQLKAGEAVKLEELETPMEILTQPESEKWLNFDYVESAKLAWMKAVDIPKAEKDKQYEARFDFEGIILPYVEEEINEKNRSLYHHGEEPGRPGYTLQELFQLCRSSVTQQKVVALNTIANILSLEALDLYDGIIELPIEQIFFVLRFCMDDNTPSVLNAAVRAMRNLFFSSIDETCLDALLGFGLDISHPGLSINPDEIEDDPTENDQQLAEKNLVKCLVRSDILVRIRYIINVLKPPAETIVYSIEILTRLVRDSRCIAMRTYKFEELVDSIVKNFIQKEFKLSNPTSGSGPLPEAFKFLRVLSAKYIGFARDLIKNHNVMQAVTSILSNPQVSTNSHGLKLQIEALRLWTVFTKYNLALDYFKELEPILMQLLNYHVYSTDLVPTTSYIIQTHVSALLTLMSEGLHVQMAEMFPFILETGLIKWISQCSILDDFECGKLQIISAIMHCFSVLYNLKGEIKTINIAKIVLSLEHLLNSQAFARITENIKFGSNILSRQKGRKCSPNLLTVEAAMWEARDHVVPLLQTKSCMPFICALSELIATCDNKEIKLLFLKHKNFNKYFLQLKKCHKYSLVNNWFTQVESRLIMNVLKIAVSVRTDIDMNFFYESTVQCMTLFTSEQKKDVEFILKNIVCNAQFFPAELLLQNLNLGAKEDVLKATLDSLNDILKVYTQVLGIKSYNPNNIETLCVNMPLKTVAPVDWIYSPIILLYSEQQQNKSSLPEEEQISLVRTCLRWISLYELHFTSLAALINPTDRFCRLACAFLGKDDLFFDKDIHTLLELCLKCILTNDEDKINFDKPIEGLNNFQDFYIQLLEQYQGVSYGDVLFGNFIMIPLAQRHNCKWRKILWSEYAGVVQIFNVTKEQLLINLEDLLNPPETDISLLKCYRRALVSDTVRKHSVLYEIASHHVENFIQKEKMNKNKKS